MALTLALDPEKIAEIQDWLRDAPPGIAWLTGSSGSGMTTMVTHLTRDMEAVWLTTGSMRSRAFLREVCSSPRAVNGKRKVLILDELDVVLGNESAMADVTFLTKNNHAIPILCILKSTRAALACDMCRKASLVVHFQPPSFEDMVAAAMRVAALENLEARPATVAALCRATPGDIRHVLQSLRADSATARDVQIQTADAVAAVLGPETRTVQDALRLFTADTGAIPAGIFEVYWQATADIGECAAFADMASLGDVVDSCIHSRQRWDLLDVYGTLTTASAAIILPDDAHITLDKFGTIWNKNYIQCAKSKTLKAVGAARMERGAEPLGATDIAFVRHMFATAMSKTLQDAAQVCRRAQLDPQSCLHMMRLWNTGYKLNVHNKIKQLMAASGPSPS